MTEPRSSHSQLPWVISGPGEAYNPAHGQPPQGVQNAYVHPTQPPQYAVPAHLPPPHNPYGPPRRSTRWPIALGIPVAILVVAVNVWAIVAIHGLGGDAKPSLSAGGGLGTIGLLPGDCYLEPANPSVSFSSVKAVDCGRPHDAQAFYSFTYPGATSTAPSDDDLRATAQPRCEDAAKTRVDQGKLPPAAHAGLLFPDDRTWARGFHDITCVYAADTAFTGSFVKGGSPG
jgi:hypothetical protein